VITVKCGIKKFPKILFLMSYYWPQVLSLLVILSLSGCSLAGKIWTPTDHLFFRADKNVNPDINQRPSPIQVKVYELSSRVTFDNLSFEQAFNQGDTLLGDELLSTIQFTIQPGEQNDFIIELQESVNFIAILAAYRHIDNADWKHAYEISPYSHTHHWITLTQSGINFSTKKWRKNV
jgi:type VI secretion system protein VasD